MELYPSLKLAIGLLVAANFFLPLFTVVRTESLHDEPMAVLAGNMALSCFLFGLNLAATGVANMIGGEPPWMCASMNYWGMGLVATFSASQVAMAVDQFVAVVHPLHYYLRMGRYLGPLQVAVWTYGGLFTLLGFICYQLSLPTFAEVAMAAAASQNATNVTYEGCRWETGMADAFTIVSQLGLTTISLTTAGLFLYTAVIGIRCSNQLKRDLSLGEGLPPQDQRFQGNFRLFKRIAAALSLTVVMDLIGPTFRTLNRWWPMPKLTGFIQLAWLTGLIFQGWAYGLLNAQLRAAYKKTLDDIYKMILDCGSILNCGRLLSRQQPAQEEGAACFVVSREVRRVAAEATSDAAIQARPMSQSPGERPVVATAADPRSTWMKRKRPALKATSSVPTPMKGKLLVMPANHTTARAVHGRSMSI